MRPDVFPIFWVGKCALLLFYVILIIFWFAQTARAVIVVLADLGLGGVEGIVGFRLAIYVCPGYGGISRGEW